MAGDGVRVKREVAVWGLAALSGVLMCGCAHGGSRATDSGGSRAAEGAGPQGNGNNNNSSASNGQQDQQGQQSNSNKSSTPTTGQAGRPGNDKPGGDKSRSQFSEPVQSVSGGPSTPSDEGSASAVAHQSVAEPGAPEGTLVEKGRGKTATAKPPTQQH